MQAAPSRYVSVSELYSTDEVELLLDEIRELEPTSCRGEDVQDFEIAGSGAGGGGLSPGGTELTERSWDSHAGYARGGAGPAGGARALAPLYWRCSVALVPRALLALLCCAACSALWAGAGLRLALLPLAGRLQLLLLGALSSALLHATLLVMHVTRLDHLLPLDWNLLGGCTSVWSAVSLGTGGVLTLHAVSLGPQYAAAAPRLARPLQAAAVLALGGAALALLMVGAAVRCHLRRRAAHRPYRAVPPADPETDHPL